MRQVFEKVFPVWLPVVRRDTLFTLTPRGETLDFNGSRLETVCFGQMPSKHTIYMGARKLPTNTSVQNGYQRATDEIYELFVSAFISPKRAERFF